LNWFILIPGSFLVVIFLDLIFWGRKRNENQSPIDRFLKEVSHRSKRLFRPFAFLSAQRANGEIRLVFQRNEGSNEVAEGLSGINEVFEHIHIFLESNGASSPLLAPDPSSIQITGSGCTVTLPAPQVGNNERLRIHYQFPEDQEEHEVSIPITNDPMEGLLAEWEAVLNLPDFTEENIHDLIVAIHRLHAQGPWLSFTDIKISSARSKRMWDLTRATVKKLKQQSSSQELNEAIIFFMCPLTKIS